MPVYPHDTIMDTEEMVSVMMSDPRLLHVGEGEAREFLDGLYSDDDLRANCDAYWDDYVPAWVLKAHEQGKCDRLYVADKTLFVAFANLGCLCCVCGDVEKEGASMIPDRLSLAIAPRTPVFEDPQEDASYVTFIHTPPICANCVRTFTMRDRIRTLWNGPKAEFEAMVDEVLSRLICNPRFQKRANENAARWRGFRFHPRAPEQISQAA